MYLVANIDCVPVNRTFSPFSGNLMPNSSRTRLKTCAVFLNLIVSESRIVSIASSCPCSAQIAIVRQFVPARIIFKVKLA